MRILTIGGTGMLGSSIMLLRTVHEIWGTYNSNKPKSKNFLRLDITNERSVNKILNEINPDAIIHTAAITNVDLCEQDPTLAKKVHIEGTRNLVQYARDLNAFFLYISTDSVFDGTKGNYTEEDVPKPLNVYAQTKYEGEMITSKYKNSIIIRTNIYGHNWLPKQSIAEWILNILRKNSELTLFRDVFFSPLLVNNLAEVLIEITEKKLIGLYHISGPEGLSKLEFGKLIAKAYNLNENLIKSISISQLDLKAPRPLNPTLNCSKIQKMIKTTLLNTEAGIIVFKTLENSDYFNRLKNL